MFLPLQYDLCVLLALSIQEKQNFHFIGNLVRNKVFTLGHAREHFLIQYHPQLEISKSKRNPQVIYFYFNYSCI